MDRFERGLEHLLQISAKHDEVIAKHDGTIAQNHASRSGARLAEAQTDLTVTMNRLANIVIRHEERLDSIDGGDAERDCEEGGGGAVGEEGD